MMLLALLAPKYPSPHFIHSLMIFIRSPCLML